MFFYSIERIWFESGYNGVDDTSSLSDDSEEGSLAEEWNLPHCPMVVKSVEKWSEGSSQKMSIDSSSEEDFSLSSVSSLSTHRHRVNSVVGSFQSVELFDDLKGFKKSNLIPKEDPHFDSVKANQKWIPGIKHNTFINPLIDCADSELLTASAINHILLDGFYPIATDVDPESHPNLIGSRDDVINRAVYLAQLYDPILWHGAVAVDWNIPAMQSDFASFLEENQHKFRKGNAEHLAAQAAADYSWDNFDFNVDRDGLQACHGNIQELIASRQAAVQPNRLNLSRIMEHLAGYPLMPKLVKLVATGVEIYSDPKYRRNPYEAMRPQELLLQNVICKHAMDAWGHQRVLIFREEDLTSRQLKSFNFNPSFWIFKWLDIFGRWCIDPSNRSDKRLPLNGGEAKNLCRDAYGKVIYPEMGDIILAWIAYRIQHGLEWNECWLFKEDIKSCFPQLFMSPSAALHLAMRVAVGVILINFAGTFGYTGLPGAWQIVGAALLWKALQSAQTVLHLFCDDFFGFGTKAAAEHDSAMVVELIRNVMGEDALAPKKHELGQRQVILGWLINFLDSRGGATIRPKDEAIDKLCHMLFCFNVLKLQPKVFWQALASLLERYSLGLVGMRAHVDCFHKMSKNKCGVTKKDGVTKRHFGRMKAVAATTTVRFSIEIWRCVAILLWLDRDRFSMPLEQFVCFAGKSIDPVRFIGVSDACHDGMCIAIYRTNPNVPCELNPTSLIGWLSISLEYKYSSDRDGKYKHQGYVEYLGVVFQYLLMNILFPLSSRSQLFSLIMQIMSDNNGALAWIEKRKCVSLAAQNSCMAMNYMQMFSKIDIVSAIHYPGKDMKDIDIESRRKQFLQPHQFCKSLPPQLQIDASKYPIIQRLVEICDPTIYNPCLQDMHKSFVSIAQECGPFIHRSVPGEVQFKEPPLYYELVQYDYVAKKIISLDKFYNV